MSNIVFRMMTGVGGGGQDVVLVFYIISWITKLARLGEKIEKKYREEWGGKKKKFSVDSSIFIPAYCVSFYIYEVSSRETWNWAFFLSTPSQLDPPFIPVRFFFFFSFYTS